METTVIKKNAEFVVASSSYKFKKKGGGHIFRNTPRFAKPKNLNIHLERPKNPVGIMFIKSLSSLSV